MARHLVEQGQSVSVLSRRPDQAGAQAYAQAGVNVLLVPDSPADRRGRCRLSPHPFDAELAKGLAEHAGNCDAVVLVREKTLQYSPEARQADCVIADLVDDPVLAHAAGDVGGWARSLFRLREGAYEKRFGKDVDRFVFVSDADAAHFARRRPGASVTCVPNGVDLDYFNPDAVADDSDSTSPSVVFVGNLAYAPNEQAALSLIGDIAPRVWKTSPEVRFIVVGPDPSEAIRSLAGEGVTVTGAVSDVRPYVKAATVVSLPMESGTGMKNKLLEAWAMRRAVVATRSACEGSPSQDGQNIVIADSAEAHAEAIARLIPDQATRERLGAAGRSTVENELTWSHAAERLERLCLQEV